jgi:O-antigen/teichoic acid export membrane protein
MKIKVQLFQNFLWRGLYFLSVFVLNVALARQYEAVQNGWINYITANFALVICFGSLSLEVSILHFGATQKMSNEKMSTFALIWVLCSAIIFAICFNYFVQAKQSITSKNLVRFCATAYVVGIMGINFFANLFMAQKQFVIANVILLISNVVLIILVPGFVVELPWLTKDVFLYFFFFSYVIQALLLVIAYYIYVGTLTFAWVTLQEFKQLLAYAAIAFMANVSFYLLTRIDYWFVHTYCSAVDLGLYTMASKIGQTLLIFSIIASGVVFVSSNNGVLTQKQQLQLYTIFQLLFLLFVFIFCISFLLGKSFFVMMLGQSFTNMYRPFLILIPGIYFLSVLTLLSAYFGSINKSIYSFYANLVGLVFMVLGNLFFIKQFGIMASAIISSVCYGIVMGYCLRKFMVLHNLKLSSFLSLKNNLLFNKKAILP